MGSRHCTSRLVVPSVVAASQAIRSPAKRVCVITEKYLSSRLLPCRLPHHLPQLCRQRGERLRPSVVAARGEDLAEEGGGLLGRGGLAHEVPGAVGRMPGERVEAFLRRSRASAQGSFELETGIAKIGSLG